MASRSSRSNTTKASVRSKLTEALVAAGVRKTAITDALNRAGDNTFRDVNGQLVQFNGDTPVYSAANPGKPKDASEWIAELSTGDGAHLFEKSSGSNTNPTAGLTTNPNATVIDYDPLSFGKNAEKIASGDVRVNTTIQ